MKKLTLLLLLCISLGAAQAQLLNPGFEFLNPDSTVQHWGKTVLLSVGIDSLGHTDSVVIDKGFYFTTTDAHSGFRALEMRNAYNFTQGTGFAGGAMMTEQDSAYSGFPLALLPVQAAPAELRFYYKFFPVNNDTASARLLVFDSTGDEIGSAAVLIGALKSSYTYVIAPVVYSRPGVPAFISLGFSTALPGRNPSFGTRFLVDDLDLPALGIQHIAAHNAGVLNCYPSPANETVYIQLPDTPTAAAQLSVIDQAGRVVHQRAIAGNTARVAVDVATWAAGSYYISLAAGDRLYSGRFIK